MRSPLCRTPWAAGAIPREGLRLLAALPASARPKQAHEIEPRLVYLKSLPFSARHAQDVQWLAKAFAKGWNSTWERLKAFPQPLQTPLYNTRDFLAAAIDQAILPQALSGMTLDRLGLAWAARRGLESLLQASQRWHEQPLEDLPLPGATALCTTLESALEPVELIGGQIEELMSEAALVLEGERMHHCVADYWDAYLVSGTRIFHLELPSGERATAEFTLEGAAHDPRFSQNQLLGPCNAEVSASMEHLAQSLLDLLNAPEERSRRVRIADMAYRAMCQLHAQQAPRRKIRRLDPRSRRELARILAWCTQQPAWKERISELFCGFIAGFQYAEGARLLDRLQIGDELLLVREPANMHDRLAVRVDWHGHTLGYIPRTGNATIARLLDSGTRLAAHIVALNPDQEPWTQVEMRVTHPPP